jgi:hypothetical protein
VTVAFDELMSDLAHQTADDLSRLASEHALLRLNERDHLQPICASAARRVAQHYAAPLDVRTSFRFKSDLWPRLGAVDIAFVPRDAKPAFVELKAGSGRDALTACAWDAVKLAFALQLGEASGAYLLAASPATDWNASGFRGAEFFTTCSFETGALRGPFLDWWRRWERDGYPAGSKVPSAFNTRAVCRVPFSVGVSEWEIAVASLHADRIEWMAWERTLAEVPADSLRGSGPGSPLPDDTA